MSKKTINNESTHKKKINNNQLFKELIQKQRKDVPMDKRLQLNDLKRICKYIDTSIFNSDECCLWNGYITNINNATKGTYINFYFKKKKVALHRLLYCNFVDTLTSEEYLKFNCENKGMCCNINHLKRFKYQKKTTNTTVKNVKNKNNYITVINKENMTEDDKKKLYLEFD